MNFNSIKEYFYRLYNICYVLVLAPLALFLFLYYESQIEKILPIIQADDKLLKFEAIFFLVSIAGLTTVHIYVRSRLAIVRKEVGLGDKMDRYVPIALVRTAVGSFSALLMNAGFYLTGGIAFAVAFGLTMIWVGWHWPTPKRFCNDLSVRSDERELLLKSKDAF